MTNLITLTSDHLMYSQFFFLSHGKHLPLVDNNNPYKRECKKVFYIIIIFSCNLLFNEIIIYLYVVT